MFSITSIFEAPKISKAERDARRTLDDLRLELQDMELQIIQYNNHRNSILERINYFESKLEDLGK